MRAWPLTAAALALGCATAAPAGDWRPGMVSGSVVIMEGDAPEGLVPPPSPPGVIALTREAFYDIRGTTAEDMHASMLRNGPGEGDNRVVGNHEWDVRLTMPRVAGRACALPRGRVGVQSTITMPRWLDRAEAAPELVAAWDRFLTALWAHEYGHREIAYAAAAETRRTLERFEGRPCDVARALNDALAAVEARHRRMDRQYDSETAAGYRQGVVWPPR